MRKSFLFLALAAAFAVSSCNKDDDATPDPVAAEPTDPANDPAAIKLSMQLLTGHAWKLTALTQQAPGQTSYNDVYNNNLPACQRDDVYTFEVTGNNMKVGIGFAPCFISEPDKSGTWELKNAKTLNITVPDLVQAGLTGAFTVFQLDNSSLILKQTLNGSEYLATYEKYLVPSKLQLLTATPWKTDSIMLQVPGSQPINIGGTSACEKDNQTLFFTNGTFETTEGPTKCRPNDPQLVVAGNWQFLNGETRMIYDGDEFDIELLTPTKMILKYDDSGLTATYSFSK